MVVVDPEDEDDLTPSIIKDHIEPHKSIGSPCENHEAEITILNNRMVDMEETLGIVKMEGSQLKQRNTELES